MENTALLPNSLFIALKALTLEQVDQRIAELNGERAALSLMRRSLIARERCRQRASKAGQIKTEVRND